MKNSSFLMIVGVIGVGVMMISTPIAFGTQMDSPKKQMADGIAMEDVVCNAGLTLMLRESSGSAACVKPSSATQLEGKGWGTILKEASMIMTEEHEQTIEEKMMMGEKKSTGEEHEETMEEKMMMEDKKVMDEEEKQESMMTKEKMSIGGIDVSMAAPLEGSPDATITIIEFGDFQCPKCDQWFLNEKPIIKSNYLENGLVKLYFLDFTFLGDDSVAAAQASYCADEQGKYAEFHSTLYENQGGINDGWANEAGLKAFAAGIGLDTEVFDECLESGKHADRVSYNKQVGASIGVEGTPTFFIIGSDGSTERIDGPQPANIFDAVISDLSS